MSTFKQPHSYPLRMPADLRQRLEEMAKASGKSVNAEIVSILQKAVDNKTSDLSAVSSGDLLNEVIARYGQSIRIEIGGKAAEDLKGVARRKK